MTAKHRDFRRIPLREHDGVSTDALAALGLCSADILDLASCTNTCGPPPSVRDAIRNAVRTSYPHPTARAAREAIAERFRTTPERVVLGNGAFELLWTAARVLMRSGDTVLIVQPCPGELAAAARHVGARVVQWHAVERTGHRVDLEQIEELIALEKPAVVGLCGPATPTGASVPFANVKVLAARFADTYFVVDQSLLALSDDHDDLSLLPHDNVVCVRSLGKELGVPGLRVGYALADAVIAERMESCRPAYSTSSAAQAAALAAMHEGVYLAHSRERLLKERDRLSFVLGKLGLVSTPSVAPFLLVRMARAGEVAGELLENHRIAVRECSAYGLPDHLRISGLSDAAEKPFEAAMRAVMERRKLTHGRDC